MILLLEPVALSVRTTDMLLPLLLSDVTDEVVRQRVRDGRGPSIAWTVGHLLEYRCELLSLLGVERKRPFAVDFSGSGATDGLDYPATAELRAAWQQLQAELTAALESASEESVRRVARVKGTNTDLPALESIVGFAWHEAYHTGALVALRMSLGLPGLKELALTRAAAPTS
jgi:uncharacterized damage-inducible protein DinB